MKGVLGGLGAMFGLGCAIPPVSAAILVLQSDLTHPVISGNLAAPVAYQAPGVLIGLIDTAGLPFPGQLSWSQEMSFSLAVPAQPVSAAALSNSGRNPVLTDVTFSWRLLDSGGRVLFEHATSDSSFQHWVLHNDGDFTLQISGSQPPSYFRIGGQYAATIDVRPVPGPSSVLLLAPAVFGLAIRATRRRCGCRPPPVI